MHDHAGRVQVPAEPRRPGARQLDGQARLQVARIAAGADLVAGPREDGASRLDREWIVDGAGKLVDGWQASQFHS